MIARCQNGGTCSDSIKLANSQDESSWEEYEDVGPGVFDCAHCAGYIGGVCEIDIDEWESSPCQNGGTCCDSTTDGQPVDPDSCECVCFAGYGGIICDVALDEGHSSPCQNGCTCSDSLTLERVGEVSSWNEYEEVDVGEYACACTAGFEGTRCETNADACGSSPCQNSGTCTTTGPLVVANGFDCAFAAGYSGLSVRSMWTSV